MDDEIVTIERAGIKGDVVQIRLGEGAELPTALPLIEETFLNCFKNNDVQIILNFANVKFPPTKFIALLIEAIKELQEG